MIPFPLPPALARLHERLERYTEEHEEGFFLAEQDRAGRARGQPVLVFVSPDQLRAAPTPGKSAPAWMGEVVGEGPLSERVAAYARAGVREYWRAVLLEGADPARIEVHQDPDPVAGVFRRCEVYRGQERVRSLVFAGLVLSVDDLR